MDDVALLRPAGGVLTPAQVELLRPFVSEARQARIEAVIGQRTRTLTVVLDHLEKRHNLSAVLRTCDAFGIQDVHLVHDQPLIISRGTTQGAHKWLNIRRHRTTTEAIAALKAAGYLVAASVLAPDARDIGDLDPLQPLALLMGNEKDGLSKEAVAAADVRFTLPMRGFVQSLNVSVAAALCLGFLVERRVAALGSNGDLDAAARHELRSRWYRDSVRHVDGILKALGDPTPIDEDDDSEECLDPQ